MKKSESQSIVTHWRKEGRNHRTPIFLATEKDSHFVYSNSEALVQELQ